MSIPQVPIERIKPSPRNIRRDLGDLTELAQSIRAVGLLQPLVVRPDTDGGVEIIDGHRRHAAAVIAGAKALPCLAVRQRDADHRTELMLAAAMHKELTPLEQAEAFVNLRARGLTVAAIAQRTGYSESTVSARLALRDLPPDARRMVASGQLSITDATDLARQVRRAGRGAVSNARPSWFNAAHPLARAVRDRCPHDDRRVVGGVGCGECWENEIRFDEREREDQRATSRTAVAR